MNQTRVFLIFAWLMVAILLWMEWGKFNAPAVAAPTVAAAAATQSGSTVPTSAPAAQPGSTVPQAPAAVEAPAAVAAAPSAGQRVTISSDVLKLTLDGGSVLEAELLHYPQDKRPGSPAVKLFNQDPAHYYVAESGWVPAGGTRAAPNHEKGFVPEAGTAFALAAGGNEISAPFIWRGPDGVTIRRVYTLKRGEYALTVRDEVVNGGSTPWQGAIYRQLTRNPPLVKRGMTNPESFSFSGATWYDGSYQRRKFDEDYVADGRVDWRGTGGWIAMLQHHFFTAWIPQAADHTTISLDEPKYATGPRPLIRDMADPLNVAPGQTVATSARLWVGPKLVNKIKAENVPGLHRAVDYSQFQIFDLIGQGLFWILAHLHALLGNWGWSIIGLVSAVGGAVQELRQDAQVPAAHPAAEGTLRRRQAEVPGRHDGAVQEGEDQPDGRLPADPRADADLPVAVLGAGGIGGTASGAVVRLDPGPDRAGSVLHPADSQHAGDVVDPEADAGAGHGSDAAEDDAVHAAGVRRHDGLLPVRSGPVLGHQRRAGPAPAVVDDQAARRTGHRDGHRQEVSRAAPRKTRRKAGFFLPR
jgi:YidC/Oxa1 family membrane protein insertase